uniref:GCN5-related N-acetyltransferase n=1 Tax=mine drainage metagenome TaxID=410659 RepID=E6QSP8_9ZZZZ
MTTHPAKVEILLRLLTLADVAEIGHWPAYPAEFAELDYALRQDGWIAEFQNKPGTCLYGAEQSGQLVALAILAMSAPGESEFRIAIHPDQVGKGLGKQITRLVLAQGFHQGGLLRIHLLVRKNHPRAINLYQKMNFNFSGECSKYINHRVTDFYQMEIWRRDYLAIPDREEIGSGSII